MSTTHLDIYESELHKIKHQLHLISQQNPGLLQGNHSAHPLHRDPHINRLIESFAFLTAGLQSKLQDHHTDFAAEILRLIYPWHTRPLPSTNILCLTPHANTQKTNTIDKGTEISIQSQQNTCRFRTVYKTQIQPLCITQCTYIKADDSQDQQAHQPGAKNKVSENILEIRLEGSNPNVDISQLNLTNLRLHITLEQTQACQLYGQLLHECTEIRLSDSNTQHLYSCSTCHTVGFSNEEALTPHIAQTHKGHQLLSELMHCPEKFLYIDISNQDLSVISSPCSSLTLQFYFKAGHSPLFDFISKKTFALNTTPIVNLCEMDAEPIRISDNQTQYPIIPQHHANKTDFSIHSIQSVKSLSDRSRHTTYQPLYHHNYTEDKLHTVYYQTTHKIPDTSNQEDGTGTDWLMLSYPEHSSSPDYSALLSCRLLCTNHNIPYTFNHNETPTIRFWSTPPECVAKMTCLSTFTPIHYHHDKQQDHWQLIACLHQDLTDNFTQIADLRRLLESYEQRFSHHQCHYSQLISQIDITTEHTHNPNPPYLGFISGNHITLTYNEEKSPHFQLALLGEVLNTLLTTNTAFNSFTQVTLVGNKGLQRITWPVTT